MQRSIPVGEVNVVVVIVHAIDARLLVLLADDIPRIAFHHHFVANGCDTDIGVGVDVSISIYHATTAAGMCTADISVDVIVAVGRGGSGGDAKDACAVYFAISVVFSMSG